MSLANRYGFFDRVLHRFAFATTAAQRGCADLEDRMFRRELDALQPGPPVFVTALPRAGTTILLELLAGMDVFASHRYRDMPFVLTPLLWARMASRRRDSAEPTERAHGDGIRITQDSPEAFEEMVWRAFWRSHYRADRIEPWARCDDAEFVDFLRRHMHKVTVLRARDKETARRYVSKNNLNVARIPALLDALPDARMVVPFRDPLQHAHSLLRQHRRFSQMHRDDAFARRYMAGVGHFDFGQNLKPVDFRGFMEGRDLKHADELPFWLDYWIAAYRHVLTHVGHARLLPVRFEALGDDRTLVSLAAHLDVDVAAVRQRATILESKPAAAVDDTALSSAAVRDALDLYAELRGHAPA